MERPLGEIKDVLNANAFHVTDVDIKEDCVVITVWDDDRGVWFTLTYKEGQ